MLFCPFTRCLLSQVKRRRPSVQLLCITFLFTCSLAHALAFWCWTGKTLLTADPFKVIEKAGAWFFNVEAYKTNKRNHEASICTVAEGTILPFSHTGRWACATTQRTGFGSCAGFEPPLCTFWSSADWLLPLRTSAKLSNCCNLCWLLEVSLGGHLKTWRSWCNIAPSSSLYVFNQRVDRGTFKTTPCCTVFHQGLAHSILRKLQPDK